ncbi:MAG: leucyl aminopeptidase family protein [Candidatus Nanopelagicales bacterium]
MRAEIPTTIISAGQQASRLRGVEVAVIGLRPGPDGVQTDPEDQRRLADWGVDLPRRLSRRKATAEVGQVHQLDLECDLPVAALAVGLGTGRPAELRRAAAYASRHLRGREHVADYVAFGLDPEGVRAWTEGLLLGSPGFTMATTSPPAPAQRITMVGLSAEQAAAVTAGERAGQATAFARRLVQTPGNIKSPAWLAEQFAASRWPDLAVRIWDVPALQADGFGGILAVGAGSARPPRLVRLDYPGASPRARRVMLVGKGITFDAGGLSLKAPERQIPMKTDMTGAAVVGAVMGVLPAVCPADLAVTALLCLAENLPSGSAVRPGDVITHYGGLTSEIRNTDAEGRLVLADGLAYAVAELEPAAVVDVATLTSAATLGLGRRYGALFSNSDPLAGAICRAGDAAGEEFWRMPLYEAYRERIASEVADQANADIGPGPRPGAITAALFLSRFVGDVPWAHLDIAGPGRSDSERADRPKGGTGFGVRALLRWIEAGAPA